MSEMCDLSLSFEDLPPTLQSAVEYWRALKGKRIGPTWREVDMLQLPLELLSTTVVVDCFDDLDGINFCYRFYGSGLRNIHDIELTGKTPDDVPVPVLARFIKNEFRQVYETQTPVFSAYHCDVFHDSGDFLNVVRLPLSDDGIRVSNILGVTHYRKNDLALTDMFKKIIAD